MKGEFVLLSNKTRWLLAQIGAELDLRSYDAIVNYIAKKHRKIKKIKDIYED